MPDRVTINRLWNLIHKRILEIHTSNWCTVPPKLSESKNEGTIFNNYLVLSYLKATCVFHDITGSGQYKVCEVGPQSCYLRRERGCSSLTLQQERALDVLLDRTCMYPCMTLHPGLSLLTCGRSLLAVRVS
eukprot:1652468-Amphidinium_carterae.1